VCVCVCVCVCVLTVSCSPYKENYKSVRVMVCIFCPVTTVGGDAT